MTPIEMVDSYICYLCETTYGLGREAGIALTPKDRKLKEMVRDKDMAEFIIWLMEEDDDV